MTTALSERRKGQAVRLGLIAGVLAIVAAVTIAIDERSSRPNLASGPVVPGLAETISGGQRISIVSAEASYGMECARRGEECAWVMRDRGDYPILPERLAALTQGLQQLRYLRRMTSDPSKHGRLGVDDPRQGGRGVLVRIEGERGELLVNLILGVEPNGTYARRPDDDQAWAVEGDLPPLRDAAAWLDLTPLALAPEALARVEIVPPEGRAYILARATPEGEFIIATPRVESLGASLVAVVAQRITHLNPVDVQPAPAIQGSPSARLRVLTYEGVAIDGELIASGERVWLKLVARATLAAPTPEQEAAALAINNRASAWAYALSAQEAAALTPPLASLLPGAPP